MRNELYHYGVKGMKWDPNRPHSRKRNDSGKSGTVEKRGEGLGASTSAGNLSRLVFKRGGMKKRIPGRKRLGSALAIYKYKIRNKKG